MSSWSDQPLARQEVNPLRQSARRMRFEGTRQVALLLPARRAKSLLFVGMLRPVCHT